MAYTVDISLIKMNKSYYYEYKGTIVILNQEVNESDLY